MIVIKLEDATLTHDTDLFRKMDPYVALYYGGDRRVSVVRENAGKHPRWGQELGFQRTLDTLLRVQVWDKDKHTKDDLVGQGQLNLAPLLMMGTPGPFSQCVELHYKNKKAGWLNMEVMFQNVPIGGMGFPVGHVGVGLAQPIGVAPGYTQPWTYQPYTTYSETVKKSWVPL